MKKSKRKALGQHFLKNPRIINKIIQVINPQKNDLIIEIGVGKGSLTLPIARLAGRVIAIEKDHFLVAYLKEIIPKNVILIEGDILQLELKKILANDLHHFPNIKLVGNLPYSIASQIIINAYENKNYFPFWVFLLQEEMAQRLILSPGSKKLNPLAIMLQNYFEIQKVLKVKPQSFHPPPQVFSALLSFKKRKKPLFLIQDEKQFHSFLKRCFAKRRKTLRNNLLATSFNQDSISEALATFEISPHERAEDLDLKTFFNLYNFFYLKKDQINHHNIT